MKKHIKNIRKLAIFLFLLIGLTLPLFPQFQEYFGAQLFSKNQLRANRILMANTKVVKQGGSLKLDLSKNLGYRMIYQLVKLPENPSLKGLKDGEKMEGESIVQTGYKKYASLSEGYYRIEVIDELKRDKIWKQMEDEKLAEQKALEEKKAIEEAQAAEAAEQAEAKRKLEEEIEAGLTEEEKRRRQAIYELREIKKAEELKKEEEKTEEQLKVEEEAKAEEEVKKTEEEAKEEERRKEEEALKAQAEKERKERAGRVAWLVFQAIDSLAKEGSVQTAYKGPDIPEPDEVTITDNSDELKADEIGAAFYSFTMNNKKFYSPYPTLNVDWQKEFGNMITIYKVCPFDEYGNEGTGDGNGGGCSKSVKLIIDMAAPGEEDFSLTLSSVEEGLAKIGDSITIAAKNENDVIYYFTQNAEGEISRIQKVIPFAGQVPKKTFIIDESWYPTLTLHWYLKDEHGNISRNFSETFQVQEPENPAPKTLLERIKMKRELFQK